MKTALISGGSRGIGRAAAQEFAAHGYAVGVIYNASEQAAFELCRQVAQSDGVAMPLCCDVADADAVALAVQRFEEQLGHVDVLVTAAGIAHYAEFCDTSARDWRRVFDVNVGGTANLCRAVLPGMVRRNSGSIVTVSSIWGVEGASCEAAYAASKGAIIALSKSLEKEFGPSGIRVNCIAPGFVDTDMNAGVAAEVRGRFEHIATPQEVAREIFALI